MENNNVELLKQAMLAINKKSDSEKVDTTIKIKLAKVIGVDEDTQKVFAYFIDDSNQNTYTFNNKSGETLSVGDNIKIFYTTNPAKGWVGLRSGATINNEVAQKLQTGSAACSAVTADGLEIQRDDDTRWILLPSENAAGTVGGDKLTIRDKFGWSQISIGGGDENTAGLSISNGYYTNLLLTPSKFQYFGRGSKWLSVDIDAESDSLDIHWGDNTAYQIWLRGDYLDIRCNGKTVVAITASTSSFDICGLHYDGETLTIGGKKILTEE